MEASITVASEGWPCEFIERWNAYCGGRDARRPQMEVLITTTRSSDEEAAIDLAVRCTAEDDDWHVETEQAENSSWMSSLYKGGLPYANPPACSSRAISAELR